MNLHRRIICSVLVLSFCLLMLGGCSNFRTQSPSGQAANTGVTETLRLTEYNPEDDIEQALQHLTQSDETCDIIGRAQATQRKVSVVFLGLVYGAQMEQILTSLQEHNTPTIFLVDGMSAAEGSNTLEMIEREGFDIGNYTLSADRYMQQKTPEEIATSYAHAQCILETITGETPSYCAANATELDHNVLHAASSAGLKTAVQPSSYIVDTSFPSFNSAMGYVSRIESGEIIAVKLNDTLDAVEYEAFEQDERPANDFQDALEEEQQEEPNTDIAVTVQYLLDALEATETAVVPLNKLHLSFDEEVAKMFVVEGDVSDYEVPEHEPVDTSWFDNALFIGDSMTQTLSTYKLDLPSSIAVSAYRSITPIQFINNVTVAREDGTEVAIFDELCTHHPDKIFILLGMNVLASGSDSNLIETYEMLLGKLKEQFPGIPIYVQGVTPVGKIVATQRVTLTVNRIKKVNLQIAQMAQRNGCYYIDMFHALANEEELLSPYISQEDGIHLNQRGADQWVAYLKTHVLVEGTSEQPVAEVSTTVEPSEQSEAEAPTTTSSPGQLEVEAPAATNGPKPVETKAPAATNAPKPAETKAPAATNAPKPAETKAPAATNAPKQPEATASATANAPKQPGATARAFNESNKQPPISHRRTAFSF